MRKRKNFIFNQYKLSWEYIYDSRKFIYFAILIFLLFILIGLLFPTPPSVSRIILEFFQEISEKVQKMSNFEVICFIFLNNLGSSFFAMILGVVLGVFPLFSAISNGYVLGFASKLVIGEEGLMSLWKLFPHGIFELPAIFISLGLGIRFGSFIFYQHKWKSLKKFFWNSLRVFLFVVLPLLVIAAFIEGSLIVLFR